MEGVGNKEIQSSDSLRDRTSSLHKEATFQIFIRDGKIVNASLSLENIDFNPKSMGSNPSFAARWLNCKSFNNHIARQMSFYWVK